MDMLVAPNDTAPLIAVDPRDVALTPLDKASCHQGDGVLHRAFSVFLFDRDGRVLLQRRSAYKPLWPGWWANSCCSHPRWGEPLKHAVQRRVREELGVPMLGLPCWRFRFIYHARYRDVGSEHELCHVFTGQLAAPPRPDPREIAEWCWLDPRQLQHALADPEAPFTPWLRLEWPRLWPRLACSKSVDVVGAD